MKNIIFTSFFILVGCSTPLKSGNVTYIAENVVEITGGDDGLNNNFANNHCHKNGYSYAKLTRSYQQISYYSCMK